MIGIYQIRNTKNNKIYIGSSCNIQNRFTTHKRALNNNKHHSFVLQKEWKIYGSEFFIFEIIELCQRNELIKREQIYLNKFLPYYNISLNASAPMMNRKHRPETIEKMKSRIYKKGKEHHLYGKKLSKSHVKKIILKRIGKKRSDESKKKMSEISKKSNAWHRLKNAISNSKKKIKDSNGNIFNSVTEAALFWSVSPATVCDILKGRHSKTRKKISFQYYSSEEKDVA